MNIYKQEGKSDCMLACIANVVQNLSEKTLAICLFIKLKGMKELMGDKILGNRLFSSYGIRTFRQFPKCKYG